MKQPKISDACSTGKITKKSTVTVNLTSSDASRKPINLELTLEELDLDPDKAFADYQKPTPPTETVKEINSRNVSAEEKKALIDGVMKEYKEACALYEEVCNGQSLEDLIGIKLQDWLVNNKGYSRDPNKDKPHLSLDGVTISTIKGLDGVLNYQLNVKAVWG